MPFWYYTHTPTLPFLLIFLLLYLLNIIFCFNIQNMPLLYNIYNSQDIRLTLFNWSSIMSFGSPISNLLINILGFLKSFYNTYKSWIGLGNCSVINSLRNTLSKSYCNAKGEINMISQCEYSLKLETILNTIYKSRNAKHIIGWVQPNPTACPWPICHTSVVRILKYQCFHSHIKACSRERIEHNVSG